MKLKDMNMLDKLSIVNLTQKAPESSNTTTERKRTYDEKVQAIENVNRFG